MSPEVQFMMIMLRGHLARAQDDERGVSAIEWVIIAVAVAILALGVAKLVSDKVTAKGNSLNLN